MIVAHAKHTTQHTISWVEYLQRRYTNMEQNSSEDLLEVYLLRERQAAQFESYLARSSNSFCTWAMMGDR